MSNGSLSVDTQHLFPIIKKWLYSEKDIFLREIISNACDAVSKHKRLLSLGEIQSEAEESYKITVKTDKEAATITVTDNGIGMSKDELDKYINNIALSGAMDFISKYEGDTGNASGIIGHFGLGFYSAFMVSEKVEIITKSYTDAPAIHWECDDSGEYTMEETDCNERGTTIIMHIADDEKSLLDDAAVKKIIEKYCSFMPVSIYYAEEEAPLNDTNPLWARPAKDITDEQYKEFYKKVFNDYQDPLLWVHINADLPLNFKGIVFFPARKTSYEPVESELKLFYNSVFVASNITEACPDYLVNLKGVLDCPELPLNVSRSYLQNDAYVKKIASHISKKLTDRLSYLFNNNREDYEKCFNGIKPYIKYACMRDDKFYSRAKDSILFEKESGGFVTLDEYLGEKKTGTVYYTDDAKAQSYYVGLFKEKGIDVLVFDSLVDTNFAQFLESKLTDVKFSRIDADLSAVNSAEQNEQSDNKTLRDLFAKAIGSEDAKIEFVTLSESDAAALISVSESGRRFADMMRAYKLSAGEESIDMPTDETLTVNLANPIIKKLAEAPEGDERAVKTAKHIRLSALLMAKSLTPEQTKEFIALNNELL